MSLKNDRWIRFMNETQNMIEPFVREMQSFSEDRQKIISYGPSSFGYDVRAGFDWKIFTDLNGTIVDPKRIDEGAFSDISAQAGESVIIPPNSYALCCSL